MKLPLPILINCYWYLTINEGFSVCMCASSILSTVYPLVGVCLGFGATAVPNFTVSESFLGIPRIKYSQNININLKKDWHNQMPHLSTHTGIKVFNNVRQIFPKLEKLKPLIN